MKKLFVCSARSLLIAMLLIVSSASWAATSEVVGLVLLVNGEVNALNDGESRELTRRASVYEGDIIITGSAGIVQLRMKDGALISLTPSSEFVLETYDFETSGQKDNVAVNLLRGGLRTISGQIEKNSFKLSTPTSTLAIRGTVFDVFVGADGTTTVVLREGGVELTGLAGGSQLLNTPGLSVTIRPGQAPSSPEPVPPAIQELLNRLFVGSPVDATWERSEDGRVVVRLTMPPSAPHLPGQEIILNLVNVPPIVQTLLNRDGHPPVLDYCQQNPYACSEGEGSGITPVVIPPRGPIGQPLL
ncbi:MAG: FecR domain-containing protein [Pseudomonadales bacterium]|nr:FecR domain-containing protein [Pseudomonadales bacterium]